MFASFTLIISLAALFSYINHKFLRLPSTIGLLVLALISALVIILLQNISHGTYQFFCRVLVDIDFKTILMDVMLSFLLFAGALHVNLKELEKQTLPVFLFATVGVLISTFVIGGFVWMFSMLLGHPIPLIHGLLFGAIVSPTDPIAVLAILKDAHVAKSLKIQIEGESLFNDGVGVVVFLGLLTFASSMEGEFGLGHIAELVFLEIIGGLTYGLALGYIAWKMLKSIQDDPKICIMITLSVAMSGYALASLIHVSGPIAMVVSGLYIGNRIDHRGFSISSEKLINIFWEMIDEILNAVLFVLIGLTVFILDYEGIHLLMGMFAIVVGLVARFIAVGIPFSLIKGISMPKLKTIYLLTWGGLRGGISVALALSLTDQIASKDVMLVMTYCVVIFSIIAQGLTLEKLVKAMKLGI